MATPDLGARLRVLTVIWVSFMASAVVYVAAAFAAVTFGTLRAADTGLTRDQVMLGFAVLAVAAGVAAWVVRAKLLAPEALARHGDPVQAYHAAHVFGCALGEVPAIAGLAATLLTASMEFVVSGAVVSLALIGLVCRPTAEGLQAAARSGRGVR